MKSKEKIRFTPYNSHGLMSGSDRLLTADEHAAIKELQERKIGKWKGKLGFTKALNQKKLDDLIKRRDHYELPQMGVRVVEERFDHKELGLREDLGSMGIIAAGIELEQVAAFDFGRVFPQIGSVIKNKEVAGKEYFSGVCDLKTEKPVDLSTFPKHSKILLSDGSFMRLIEYPKYYAIKQEVLAAKTIGTINKISAYQEKNKLAYCGNLIAERTIELVEENDLSEIEEFLFIGVKKLFNIITDIKTTTSIQDRNKYGIKTFRSKKSPTKKDQYYGQIQDYMSDDMYNCEIGCIAHVIVNPTEKLYKSALNAISWDYAGPNAIKDLDLTNPMAMEIYDAYLKRCDQLSRNANIESVYPSSKRVKAFFIERDDRYLKEKYFRIDNYARPLYEQIKKEHYAAVYAEENQSVF